MACTRQDFLRGRLVAKPALSIAKHCLSLSGTVCRVCEQFCDIDAIRFRLLGRGRSEPMVDLERCTSCGACAAACPVGAITISIAGGEA